MNLRSMSVSAIKREFFKQLVEMPLSLMVSKWILAPTPYVFSSDLDAHLEWRERLSRELGVDSQAITLVGSASLGFSLNPNKNYKPFDEKSDVDVAVISGYYFDISWHHLRNLGSRRYYSLSPAQKNSVADHTNRLIYWGTIATDRLLPIFPYSARPQ